MFFPAFFGCSVCIEDITWWREDMNIMRANKILFSPLENNTHIFKLRCNVLLIDQLLFGIK